MRRSSVFRSFGPLPTLFTTVRVSTACSVARRTVSEDLEVNRCSGIYETQAVEMPDESRQVIV
jgi:hypothetical protein